MAETRKLLANFIHQALEVVDVFKAAVDAGKTDVGDFVEFLEFTHDELANAGRGDFALAQGHELFFDAFDGVVHLLSADGTFTQSKAHGFKELVAFVFDAAAVFLDDVRKADVRALVGGVALFTGAALAAAANGVTVFGHAGLDDLGF